MAEVVVWHNPGCGSSRSALQLLSERGVEVEIVPYLKRPPGADELRRVLGLLGGDPAALVRTADKRFKELGLSEVDVDGVDAVVDLLVAHPALIQRPVVIRGARAVIARPPARALELV